MIFIRENSQGLTESQSVSQEENMEERGELFSLGSEADMKESGFMDAKWIDNPTTIHSTSHFSA